MFRTTNYSTESSISSEINRIIILTTKRKIQQNKLKMYMVGKRGNHEKIFAFQNVLEWIIKRFRLLLGSWFVLEKDKELNFYFQNHL